FLDQPQTARGGQRRDTEVPASLIVSGRAPATSLRQRLNPREPIIKTEIEIDALHLTIGDQIGSCPELIVHGEADRVPDGLVPVIGTKQFRLASDVVAELGVPARKRPAAD